MLNIKDVAREAMVSIATVSRAFNNPDIVSDETKAKIYSVAERLGYVPSLPAKNLRRSIVGTIIVLIPDVSNAFFIDIVHGIEDYAEVRGYNVLMGRFNINNFEVNKYIQLVRSKAADGMVMALGHDRRYRAIPEANGIKIVTIEEEFMESPFIYIDNADAIDKITDYLVSKGHRHIGFLGFQRETERFTAFKKALERNGLEYDKAVVKRGGEIAEEMPASARKYVEGLLKLPYLPDAIVCASDVLAASVIKCLLKAGVRIPEDVAVTGFDNVEIADLFHPSITTVEQPRHMMGREAAKLLINSIEGDKVSKKIILKTRIVIRESA